MISILPPLRWLDSAGGIALGLFTGLAMCWAVGAVLLYLPGQTELRRLAQESRRRLGADGGAAAGAGDRRRRADRPVRGDRRGRPLGSRRRIPRSSRARAVRAARPSVVRVRGNACGLGVEGSGWIVRPGLVVTNAHVVAGIEPPVIDRRGGRSYSARVVSFDARNDVAILRVSGLQGRPLGAPSRRAANRGRCSGSPRTGRTG